MKQFRTVVLVAVCALVAAPAFASTTTSYSGLNVSITGNGKGVSFPGGITLITLSSPSTLDYSAPPTSISELLGALGGLIKPGTPIKIGDLGGGVLPIRPGYPPTHPIPEGRTAILYGVGLCLVGWVLFRLRRTQRSS